MTDTARRGRPGYDRDGMLRVAVQLFIEQGYDATSVSALAARLGLSKSALYHHFTGKEELLQRALDDALSGLEAALEKASGCPGTAADRLAAALRGAVSVLAERLPAVTLLLRVRGNSDVERHALARRRAFDRHLSQLVRQAQDEGAIRPDIEAPVAARLLFGMVNSLVEWYHPAGAESADALASDVLAIALDGLRPR